MLGMQSANPIPPPRELELALLQAAQSVYSTPALRSHRWSHLADVIFFSLPRVQRAIKAWHLVPAYLPSLLWMYPHILAIP